jgi:hypothetical protein
LATGPHRAAMRPRNHCFNLFFVISRNIVINRGHADSALVDAFLSAGWSKANLVDTIVAIGDKTVTNYLHATTRVPLDFPAAPKLSA